MVTLDLDPDERRILREVLESYLSDLRMEIADTDLMDFREMLKERKAVILKAVRSLEPEAEEGGS